MAVQHILPEFRTAIGLQQDVAGNKLAQALQVSARGGNGGLPVVLVCGELTPSTLADMVAKREHLAPFAKDQVVGLAIVNAVIQHPPWVYRCLEVAPILLFDQWRSACAEQLSFVKPNSPGWHSISVAPPSSVASEFSALCVIRQALASDDRYAWILAMIESVLKAGT